MFRYYLIIGLGCAGMASAQTPIEDPNGTVTGVFLGKEIALDVACTRSPLFPDGAEVATHTPLSQSLIDDVSDDAIAIAMFNGGASFLANIDGAVYMKVDTDLGVPAFPLATSGDDFDILITCPDGF